ncbi:MAG: guanylate kinase [Candidatus Omnitrophota bacterium]
MADRRPQTVDHRPGQGKVFVVSGPSGSGKTTLIDRVFKNPKLKRQLARSISFTTRPKRAIEKQGAHYFFISELKFQAARRAKKILEWTRYLGYYYATPKDRVDKYIAQGKPVVLCLDLKGALKVKKLYKFRAVTIFVEPPSIKELRQRIKGRCQTDKKEIALRLGLADKELAAAKQYDYCILNKNLEEAARKLTGIILKEIA